MISKIKASSFNLGFTEAKGKLPFLHWSLDFLVRVQVSKWEMLVLIGLLASVSADRQQRLRKNNYNSDILDSSATLALPQHLKNWQFLEESPY